MKTIVCCTVCIALTVLLMVDFEKEELPQIIEANKDLSPPIGAGPLVSIVWYKGIRRLPYKVFSSYREIQDIHYRLEYRGLKETSQSETWGFGKDDTLAFIYYSNKENSYRMTYFPFRIEGDIFYWPYGEDEKVAQILMSKGIWDEPWEYIDPCGRNYLNRKQELEQELGIYDKLKKIKQAEEILAGKGQLNQNEREFLSSCGLAKENLAKIVDFSIRAPSLNDILSELNERDVSESLIHAFAQLPKFIVEEYSDFVKSEYISAIGQYSEKYDDEGLNREEQIELFKVHQELNKQILDELKKRQDDFEKILQAVESQQNGRSREVRHSVGALPLGN